MMPGDHDHCRGFSLSLGKTPVKHISCRSNLHEYGRVTTAWPSAFGDAPHTRHGRPLPPIQPVKCPHVAQQGTWKASDFHIRRSFINAMAPCPSKQSLWVGRVREGVFCCQGGWVAEIELSGSGRGGGGGTFPFRLFAGPRPAICHPWAVAPAGSQVPWSVHAFCRQPCA